MQLTGMVVGTDTVVKATPTVLRKVILSPAAAISTLTVKDSAAVILTLSASLSGASVIADFPDGLTCGTNLTATLAGAGALAYFGY